jgi:hypothetical protein
MKTISRLLQLIGLLAVAYVLYLTGVIGPSQPERSNRPQVDTFVRHLEKK